MIREVISCDVCGTDYTKSNGWFLVSEVLSFDGKGASLAISAMNTSHAKGNIAVCGDTCLHAYISQNSGKLHEPKTSLEEK